MLTACGSGTEQAPDITETVTSSAATASVTVTVTSAVSETSVTEESKVSRNAARGQYGGENYTVTADPEKWEDIMHMLGDIKQYVSDNGGSYADMLDEACDAVFCSRSDSSVSFNIISSEIASEGEISYESAEPLYRDALCAGSGTDFIYSESTSVNGVSAIAMELRSAGNGGFSRIRMYIFWYGGRQITLTFSAAEDKYDAYIADFEEAVSSIKFT